MKLADYLTGDESPFKAHFHSAHELVMRQKINGSESGFFAFPVVSEFDLAPERLEQTVQAEAKRLNLAVRNNAWNIPQAVEAKVEMRRRPLWFGLFNKPQKEKVLGPDQQSNPTAKK